MRFKYAEFEALVRRARLFARERYYRWGIKLQKIVLLVQHHRTSGDALRERATAAKERALRHASALGGGSGGVHARFRERVMHFPTV